MSPLRSSSIPKLELWLFAQVPYLQHNLEAMMITTESQRAEFEALSRPLIKWLNENCHPNVTAVIVPTGAELSEGVCSTGRILDYVKD